MDYILEGMAWSLMILVMCQCFHLCVFSSRRCLLCVSSLLFCRWSYWGFFEFISTVCWLTPQHFVVSTIHHFMPGLADRWISYGISVRLPVCLSVCPSVTLRYCVKTRECRGMRSSPLGSPVSLVFWRQEWLMEDDSVQVKFECKEVNPLWKQPSCTHFAS